MAGRPSRIIALACLWCSHAFATLPGQDLQLDRLYEQARELLDGPMRARPLGAANGIVEAILARDPDYAAAYVELARFVLKTNYIGSSNYRDNFSEQGIETAVDLLEQAIALEPRFADSYVLYGYIAASIGRPAMALVALEEAERLASSNPWLWLNRALTLESMGQYERARDDYFRATETLQSGSSWHIDALEGLTRVGRTFEEVDDAYRAIVGLRPAGHFARGNYAAFLLRNGRYEEAIDYARRALSIQQYPHATRTLGLALYAKASDQLVNQLDPVRAALYFAEAERIYAPGQALLDAAASKWAFTIVLGLIEHGVDVDTRLPAGPTALFFATADGDEERVAALLAHGASVDVRAETGWTPLTLAIAAQSSSVVRMLLEAGADPELLGYGNVSPLDLASSRDANDILRLLEEYGATAAPPGNRALASAVRNGDLKDVEAGIEYLRFEDFEDTHVLAALQDKFVDAPFAVIMLTEKYQEVTQKICGVPALEAERATDDALTTAVQRAWDVTAGLQPSPVRLCLSVRRRTASEQQALEVPEDATHEQRSHLLALSRRVFDETLVRNKAFSDAQQVARTLATTDPTDGGAIYVEVLFSLAPPPSDSLPAFRRYESDQLESAVANLERALAARPDHSEAYALYGDLLVAQGAYGMGRVMLAHAKSINDDDPWIDVYEADRLIGVRDYPAAEALLSRLSRLDGPPRLYFDVRLRLLHVYDVMQDVEGRGKVLEELAAAFPDDAAIARQQLRYSLVYADFEQAVDIGGRLAGLIAKPADHTQIALAFLAHGMTLMEKGGLSAGAVDAFEQARRYDAADPIAVVHDAARTQSLQFLLPGLRAAGFSMDASDVRGNVPLRYAAERGDLDAVTRLLSLGADPRMADQHGITPLQAAVAEGHEAIALLLLEAGAPIDSIYNDGASIFDRALDQGLERLVERMRELSTREALDRRRLIDGIRYGWLRSLESAFTRSDDTEIASVLQQAFLTAPRTILEVANSAGRLAVVCADPAPPSGEAPPIPREARFAALQRVKRLQVMLQGSPDPATENCLRLLAGGI